MNLKPLYFPRKFFFLPTLLALLWGILGSAVWVDYSVFVVLILFTGIPHGATDHVLYQALRPPEASMNWGRFLGLYLSAMLAYGVLWYFLPTLSLLVFLLLSAYHFGQSQLLYVRLSEKHPLRTILYTLWGSWLLGSILLLHLETTKEVLKGLFPEVVRVLALSESSKILIISALTVALFAVLLILYKKKRLDSYQFWEETAVILVLLALFSLTSLWISFGVYFGIWHAGASIYLEVEGLKQIRSYSLSKFFREALPFSLVSLLGIVLLLGAGSYWETYVSLPLLFFIAISTLTLPHMVYMQKFYASLLHRREKK